MSWKFQPLGGGNQPGAFCCRPRARQDAKPGFGRGSGRADSSAPAQPVQGDESAGCFGNDPEFSGGLGKWLQKEASMFKHILLPTDGSELSAAAIQEGIRFAKSIGAQVTGLCVMPNQHPFFYETEIPMDALEHAAKRYKEQAGTYLAVIEKTAREAGVACDNVYEVNDSPYEAIIQVAEKKGCDLIMMASHGRRGVKGLLLGSETQKVLTHSSIPVLVYR
jgi:nucleotide-binding universal stress UspA family protein